MSIEKYIITKEDSNYAVIPNIICQQLADAEALGLYVYLVSLPPKWEFYKTVLRKHFKWGRDKLEKKLAILRSHNLIEPVPSRNDKGQFVEWNLHVKNGRDFTPIQNTENQYCGELSTDLDKNSTQNTENSAAVKPVTGSESPIKTTPIKATKNKSFCAPAQKKPKSEKPKAGWRQDNARRHAFADAKDAKARGDKQMEQEAKHIEESNAFKRAAMPDDLRRQISALRRADGKGMLR